MGPHAHAGAPVAFDPRDLRPAHSQEVRSEDSVHPDLVFCSAARRPCPVYLWGDGESDKGRFSIVAHSPWAVLTGTRDHVRVQAGGRTWDVQGSPLSVLEELLGDGKDHAGELPFAGGGIGYISYEQACHGMGMACVDGPLPGLCFGLYDTAYVYDHQQERGYWLGPPLDVNAEGPGDPHLTLSEWTPSVTRADYLKHVEQILRHIAAGDLYQANYTHRLTARGSVNGPALALEFRQKLATPLGAYLGLPGGHIWSLSPERLVAGQRGLYLESRPIKGTRRRDLQPQADSALSLELYHNPKDRAELLMIVDLVRNDLGRVASTGSVHVEELFGRRSYTNVHHLEAVIRADFPSHRSWTEVLSALLPGGSVTGTPKRRAVELLARLEPVPRSVYTGALGYVSSSGRADFNLPIRTLYHDGSNFYLHSGGGVVADSHPEAEYAESELKISHILELLRSL